MKQIYKHSNNKRGFVQIIYMVNQKGRQGIMAAHLHLYN
jgi:hypothetical protein